MLPFFYCIWVELHYQAKVAHRVGHFHEASNVSTFNVVNVTISLSTVLNASTVDVFHNLLKLLVNLFAGPVKLHRVLSHFKTRSCYTTSVGSFSRAKRNFILDEYFDSLRCRTHI